MSNDNSKATSALNTTKRSVRTVVVLSILAIVSAAILGFVFFVMQILRPSDSSTSAKKVVVNLVPGDSVSHIGRILQRRHVVRSAEGFVLAARLEGVENRLVAGRYELSPAMSPTQLAQLIAAGATADDLVTIPEGFTAAQVASRLAHHGIGNAVDDRKLVLRGGKNFTIGTYRPGPNLEGYLFPDTYRFPVGTTTSDAITEMIENFKNKVRDTGLLQLTPAQIRSTIILASLVEKEAEVDGDRPLIAAVLKNRMRLHMRLDCDATLQYALPAHRTRLFYTDLKRPSPYNTYLHGGLPPTPIANPGLESIRAALDPAHVGYLYYVARANGTHIFTDSLADHDRAIRSVRSNNVNTTQTSEGHPL